MEFQSCLPTILFFVLADSQTQDIFYLNNLRVVSVACSRLLPPNFLRLHTKFQIDHPLIRLSLLLFLGKLYSTYELNDNIFYLLGYGPMGPIGEIGTQGSECNCCLGGRHTYSHSHNVIRVDRKKLLEKKTRHSQKQIQKYQNKLTYPIKEDNFVLIERNSERN